MQNMAIIIFLLVNVAMRLLMLAHLLLGQTLGCHWVVTSEIYYMQSEMRGSYIIQLLTIESLNMM